MTAQSGGGATGAAGGVLSGLYPSPAFATNGTTPILGSLISQLGANVNIPLANTYVDGPQLALTVGTWLLFGVVTVTHPSSITNITAQLWDGATAIASAEGMQPGASGGFVALPLSGRVVLAAPATYRIAAAASVTNCSILAAAGNNGVGNNASTLIALRIA